MDNNKRGKRKDKKKVQQQPTPPVTPSSDGHTNTTKGTKFHTVPDETQLAEKEEKQKTQPAEKEEKKPTKKGRTKNSGKRKSKKTGFLRKLLTLRSLLILYVLGVFFVCHERTREQCGQWPLEGFCYNGISQYILTHDWFQKYIEPGVLEIKQYGKQTFDTASSKYEIHAKPLVSPYLELIQPHLQTTREYSINYVYTPAQELYDQHAKEHVEKYYDQAKKIATPILLQSQEYAIWAYREALEHNENTVRPLYRKQIVPLVGRVKKYYHTEVVPFTKKAMEFVIEKYNEYVVPTYKTHVEPHFLKLWDLIQDYINPEVKRKAEEEARRKEAIRRKKAQEELEARARAEEAAKKKAREEEQRRIKEEADRKAKKEAEAKEAIEREVKAVNDTAIIELPRCKRNIVSDIEILMKRVQSFTQYTLDDVEAILEVIKNSGAEHISKIENMVKVISVDTEKDIDQKISAITEYAKQRLENIKEVARESTKAADDSLTKLKERFDNSLQNIIDKRSSETKTAIFGKASDRNIIKETIDDVEIKILKITEDAKEEFSLRIEPEILKVKTKIGSIKSVATDIGRDIVKIRNSATKSLNQQEISAQEKSASEKSKDGQEPVGKVDPSKEGSIVNEKDQSRDPVLEQLKNRYRLRQDPVLQKLKASYNERKKSVSTTEEEVEEEEDYGEEDPDEETDD